MQSNPQRFFLLVSLIILAMPVFTDSRDNTVRARGRKQNTPSSMGRTADGTVATAAVMVEYHQPGAVASAYEVPGKAALSLIQYPWQSLGFNIAFLGRRPGLRALTLVEAQRIEVYVKSEEPPDALAFDLAHEFGHVVDLKFNDDDRRRQWMALRGIDPNTPWFGPAGCSDFDTPAGDFAETFAYLLLGPGSYHSRMAPPPTPEQIPVLAEFCKIERVSSAFTRTR